MLFVTYIVGWKQLFIKKCFIYDNYDWSEFVALTYAHICCEWAKLVHW